MKLFCFVLQSENNAKAVQFMIRVFRSERVSNAKKKRLNIDENVI